MKLKMIFFSLLVLSAHVYAQDFSIKRVEIAGNNINLYYDLLDTVAHRSYTINVFSSRDNFVSPLEKISGDHGLEVKPGPNKKISWKAMDELGGTFDGKISLEIRGRIYIPFVRLDGLYKKIKRARPYEVTWRGGTEQNILNFDLYKKGEKVTSFPNIANVGHFTLTLPSHIKPGSGYSFRITDTKNKDQIVNTSSFIIKRKIPLLLKVLPFAAMGGFIAALSKSNSKDSGIPEAPGHP